MKKTWNQIMAVNSFAVLPLCLAFLLYGTSQLLLHGDWVIFAWALGISFIALLIQFIGWLILG